MAQGRVIGNGQAVVIAWALGRIGTEAARDALCRRLGAESDAWVRDEIERATGER